MILFNVGDETPYLDFNNCLQKMHNEAKKRIDEALEIRKKAGALEDDGYGQIKPMEPFSYIDEYKDLRIKIKAVSSKDYYAATVKMQRKINMENISEDDYAEQSIDLNNFKKDTMREFLMLSLVDIKGLTDVDGQPINFDKDVHIQALIDNNKIYDFYGVCHYYQGLDAEEKKRFSQSQLLKSGYTTVTSAQNT